MKTTPSILFACLGCCTWLCACEPSDGADDPYGGLEDGEKIPCASPPETGDGTDTWLLAVYTLPEGEAVVETDVDYTLTLPDPQEGKPSAREPRAAALPKAMMNLPPSLPSMPSPYWQARLAREGRQRAGINRLVEDLRSGRRRVLGASPRTQCGECSDETLCRHGACVATAEYNFLSPNTQVRAELLGTVAAGDTTINVLLDERLLSASTRTAALESAEAFASTLPLQHSLMGVSDNAASADRDGDGRLSIVFTNETAGDPKQADIVGFFDYHDFLPASDTEATGNVADILWARVPGSGDITKNLAVGTLVHEYTHLMSYALRVQARGQTAAQETLWLDEATAHLMEDLAGWGPSNIRTVQAALSSWGESALASPKDSSEQRGRGYLLLRHIIDERARSNGAQHAGTKAAASAAAEVVSDLLADPKTGFEHTLFETVGNEGVARWLEGLFTTCNGAAVLQTAHANDYLPPGRSSLTQNVVGIDPFGSYVDARGGSLTLTGPDVQDELSPDDSPAFGTMPLSGSVYYTVIDADPAQAQAEDDASVSTLHTVSEKIQ